MLRPNYACDAPPTQIEVGGAMYDVETDWRVWIDITRLLGDLIPNADTDERRRHNAETWSQIQELAFGGALVDEHPAEVMRAVCDFAQGYPCAPMRREAGGPRVLSHDYDLNWIVLAIRAQFGVDLSYHRNEPFHWWEFRLMEQALSGDHYILSLMDARGYKGKDPELIKRRRMCALPKEETAAERAHSEDVMAEILADTEQ